MGRNFHVVLTEAQGNSVDQLLPLLHSEVKDKEKYVYVVQHLRLISEQFDQVICIAGIGRSGCGFQKKGGMSHPRCPLFI